MRISGERPWSQPGLECLDLCVPVAHLLAGGQLNDAQVTEPVAGPLPAAPMGAEGWSGNSFYTRG